MIFELAQDFHDAVAAMPPEHPKHRMLELLEEAIRRDIHFIAHHPTTLFQCMWNTCWWYDCLEAEKHYEEPEGGWNNNNAPWMLPEIQKLSHLLEHWRESRKPISSVGGWLASSRPPMVRLGSGQRMVFHDHPEGVLKIAFSPRGDVLVSSCVDDKLRLWNVLTGAQEAVIPESGSRGGLTFSPDGTRIAASSAGGGAIDLWGIPEGIRKIAMFRGHAKTVSSVAFFPDGDRMVSGSEDETLRIWDTKTGQELYILQGHTAKVRCVAVSPGGTRIASGSDDKTVRVWDAGTGKELAVLRGHQEGVLNVIFSANGQCIISGSMDGIVREWNIEDGTEGAVLYRHEERVNDIAFSPCAGRIAVYLKRSVKIWDTTRQVELMTLQGHEDDITCVAFSPCANLVATGSYDKSVRLWDTSGGMDPVEPWNHGWDVVSVAFSPNGDKLVSSSWDSTVRVWNANAGVPVGFLNGHEYTVRGSSFSPTGDRIAGASENYTVCMWDATSRALVTVLRGHRMWVGSVAFASDGRRIAGGCDDGTVRIWDADSGAEMMMISTFGSPVLSLAFSPIGDRLAIGCGNCMVFIFDLLRQEQVIVFRGHGEEVTKVAFSHNGEIVVSEEGRSDTYVRTPTSLCRAKKGSRWNVKVESPDGDWPCAVVREFHGAFYNTLRVWDSSTGRCLQVIRGSSDVAAIAGGLTHGFPWYAVAINEETVLKEAAHGTAVAWYPAELRYLSTCTGSRKWAGSSGNCLHIVTLQDSLLSH